MYGSLKRFAVAALLGAGLTGCSDFLSGPSVSQDPNNPTTDVASVDNLFVGVQSTQFATFAMSTLTMTVCGYMQQCKGGSGTGRFVEAQLNQYQMTPQTFPAQWDQAYGTGGLRDLRLARQKLEARSVRDPLYEGIAKVWEAIIVSHAADVWGDIPYSEAVRDDVPQPKLDNQLTIYNSLLTLLDEALGQIADPSGVGPGPADLVYGGNATAWTALAHTLKARIYLHTVRANCSTLSGCPVYTNVITEASQGLPVDGSLDFSAVVSGASTLEQNYWFQFYTVSGFGNDLRAGDFIVNLMAGPSTVPPNPAGRNDPRFTQYFARPEECGFAASSFASFGYMIGSCRASTNQRWITGDENALMLAEAYFNTGQTALAANQLNAVRAKYSTSSNPLPPIASPTLQDIMLEKYVALFQTLEVWSDWKRTCIPALTPTGNQGPVPGIPRRAFYGQQEFDNNRNIPSASDQVGSGGVQTDGTPVNLPGFRNKNDPPPPQGCA